MAKSSYSNVGCGYPILKVLVNKWSENKPISLLVPCFVLFLFGCQTNKKQMTISEESGSLTAENNELYAKVDTLWPEVVFNQKCEGYEVMIEYHAADVVENEIGGDAIVKLMKPGRSYELLCPNSHVPDDWTEILETKDTLWVDYTTPQQSEYLSMDSPVYFKDMDFDGKDEIVVMHKGCGYYRTNTYDVFKFDKDGNPVRLTGEPWEWLDEKMCTFFTIFVPKEKCIQCRTLKDNETDSIIVFKWDASRQKMVRMTEQ